MDWQEAAKCRGTNPDLFFPVGNGGVRAQGETAVSHPRYTEELQTNIGKQFCKGREDGIVCPVLHECLEHAMVNFIHEGVWGGLSEDSRKALRRKRLRAQRDVA